MLKSDVEKFGQTEGCPGCASIRRHGKVQPGSAHSAECSKRIFELLQREEEGKLRITGYQERRTEQEKRASQLAAGSAVGEPADEARPEGPGKRRAAVRADAGATSSSGAASTQVVAVREPPADG